MFVVSDRNGIIVFKTNLPNEGWNGWFNNESYRCPEGVYSISIKGRYANSMTFEKMGNVTVEYKRGF